LAEAMAPCSASSRRWKALSSARSREVEGAQMKRRRPPPDVRFTPIADIGTQSWNVRFVPKADIMRCSK
jgi:hypothetical protein